MVAGEIALQRDGAPVRFTWREAAADPGWCKLDWIVADPERGALANASNVLNVTWGAPDGSIVSLDGAVDPYFQEVYLETDSLPLFTRLVHELSADAVGEYVGQLEHEVVKYVVDHPNYGKVARRLYNIFRLTGRYAEAAYLRELFDEPTTALYQVAALIRTLDDADRPGGDFDPEMLIRQTDALIMAAIAALDGAEGGGDGAPPDGLPREPRGPAGRRGQDRGGLRGGRGRPTEHQRLLREAAACRP